MQDRSLHYLLVDDDEVDIRVFRRIIAGLPRRPQLHVAENGELAVDILMGRGGLPAMTRPAVIFVDLQIPGIDSLELVRELRSDPLLRRPFVFALAGSDCPDDIEAAYDAGASGYVVKSLQVDALQRKIACIHDYLHAIALPDEQ